MMASRRSQPVGKKKGLMGIKNRAELARDECRVNWNKGAAAPRNLTSFPWTALALPWRCKRPCRPLLHDGGAELCLQVPVSHVWDWWKPRYHMAVKVQRGLSIVVAPRPWDALCATLRFSIRGPFALLVLANQ